MAVTDQEGSDSYSLQKPSDAGILVSIIRDKT